MVEPEQIVVGVTGHRVLADVDRVSAGVDEALTAIQAAFPGRGLVILSALAVGADRLVAERALASSRVMLDVVFPLPRDEYVHDESEASRRELDGLVNRARHVKTLPEAASPEAAYEAVGRYVLDQSDALVAIWDGRDAQGPGGTGSIVVEARRRGLPVAWVKAGNRRPGTLEPTTLGEEQGRVVYERLPSRKDSE